MTRTFLLVVVLLAHPMMGVLAQHKTTRHLGSYNGPVLWRAIKGDTLYVDCDSVIVYNRQAQSVIRTLNSTNDSLIGALRARVALGDSIKALKDSIIVQYREINSIQNQAYTELHSRFDAADTLVRASVENTREALSLVRKIKLTSFVTSGLVGGVVGGLGIKSGNGGVFNWWGALGGTVVGLGINWALQKVID